MNAKKERPLTPGRVGGAKAGAWDVDTPSLSIPWKSVNQIRCWAVLCFRSAIVAGIALAGWPACPWLSRLVDRLTVLADALAEKSGVRA